MTGNKICSLIIDTGADVSLFKAQNICPTQVVNINKKIKLKGITENSVETLGIVNTALCFNNSLTLNHNFHLVTPDIPIQADGILGRDFLINYKCVIDFEHWLLNFNIQNVQIAVPIEDNLNDGFMLPGRSEVVRRIPHLKVSEDMVVHSEEIYTGVFCGNSIISNAKPYVKFVNTNNNPIYIKYVQFKPTLSRLNNYTTLNMSDRPRNNIVRVNKILKDINTEQIPSYAINKFETLINE